MGDQPCVIVLTGEGREAERPVMSAELLWRIDSGSLQAQSSA